MTAVAITVYWPEDLARSPQRGHRVSLEWPELVRWTSFPVVAHVKDQDGGYSLATYVGDARAKRNVETVNALGLDFDAGGVTVARVLEVLSRYRVIAYSTHSSTPEAPRCRAIVALSRPVTGEEYSDVWDHAAGRLLDAGLEVDRAARDASRLWYVPAVRPGAQYEHGHHDGAALDVERVLIVAREYRAEQERELAATRTQIGSAPSAERLASYLDKIEGAVSGQNGHGTTYRVACIIVANVGDHATQLALLERYNVRCRPRWSRRELLHKLEDARRADLRPLPDRRTG